MAGADQSVLGEGLERPARGHLYPRRRGADSWLPVRFTWQCSHSGAPRGRSCVRSCCLTGPLGTVPEVLAAYMTSVVPAMTLPTDVVIDPGKAEPPVTNLRH